MREKRQNKYYTSIRYKLVIMMISLLCFSLGLRVNAAEEDGTLGYTVSIIKPESQLDTSKDYFHIQTRPGEPQTIQVMVKSLEKEPVTIKVFAENAITSEGIQIDYTEKKMLLDKTLTLPITEMVKVQNPDITVGNFEEKKVDILITPPKESYEGLKLGDLAFQLQNDEPKSSTGVGSLFAYRIGLLMMEEDHDYGDSQTVKLTKITPQIHRGKKVLLVGFQNPEPKILTNFRLSYSLSKKGSQQPLLEKVLDNNNMAPNSNFSYPIDLGMKSIVPGEYIFEAMISNDYGSWEFTEKVKISDKLAKKMNDETLFRLVTPMWIKVVSITLVVVMFVTMIALQVRQGKWKKQAKALRRKKKRGKR